MCDVGIDAPILFRAVTRKARKEYECCECSSIISKAEEYERVDGLWDKFYEFKTCSVCAEARDRFRKLFDLNDDEGFPFGQLWECVGIE